MSKLNPVVRGILGAIGMFVISIAIEIAAAKIKGTAFSPDWVEMVLLSVFVGLLTAYGPNAAQRRKNRKNLVDSFKKKK